MDFVTSSILGGLLFDSLKFGTIKFGGLIREKLKQYLFSTDELSVIENLVESNSLNTESTIEEINSILKSSNEIKEILEKKNSSLTQKNKIKNNYGAIVGNNTGKIKIDIKK